MRAQTHTHNASTPLAHVLFVVCTMHMPHMMMHTHTHTHPNTQHRMRTSLWWASKLCVFVCGEGAPIVNMLFCADGRLRTFYDSTICSLSLSMCVKQV